MTEQIWIISASGWLFKQKYYAPVRRIVETLQIVLRM